MKRLLFLLLLCLNIVISEECFSDDEVKGIFHNIKELEYKDSVNVKVQTNLKDQILLLEQQLSNDTLIFNQLEYQLKLKDDIIKLVKPKWYENKVLWFFLGFATFYGATEAASNLK